MNVKESPWAESTRQHWTDLAQAIPELQETEFALWQRRVDNPRFAHPWPNHAYLYCVNCLRYVLRVDGTMNCWTPTSPPQELNFLVVADNSQDMAKKVNTMLSAHGYEPSEWMMRYGTNPVLVIN